MAPKDERLGASVTTGAVASAGPFTMRAAIAADVSVANNLRASDRLDLAATTREPAIAIIERSIARGGTYAFDLHGRCEAVGGVSDAGPTAVIWLLGAAGFDQMLSLPGAARLTRKWLGVMVEDRRHLFNIVPESNTRTLRWLEWLGFVRGDRHANFRGLGHDCVTMTLTR